MTSIIVIFHILLLNEACARINVIIALCLAKYWFAMTNAADAPVHQIRLYQDLLALHPFFTASADACLKRLQCHLWFVSEEMTPLALTSSLLSNEARTDIPQVTAHYKTRMDQ